MKVVIVGATGETGQAIVKGLQESPTQFDITAVTRKSSADNPNIQALKASGVKIAAVDLNGPEDELVNVLTNVDVVISAVHPSAFQDQIPLANAAKRAGVKRFIPCSFATTCPPRGVMTLREMKEDVLDHIKKIYLPYTVIDVGWWYQITSPKVPSGRLDYALIAPSEGLFGGGTLPSALTDSRDIGRYVAKIIADPRTLNKMVFAYNEVLTQRQVYETVERLSGEKLEYNYIADDVVESRIAAAKEAAQAAVPEDFLPQMMLWAVEYTKSWGIRGDNTPDHARYLGYLDAKELYPDVEWTAFETYVSELLEGKGRRAWQKP